MGRPRLFDYDEAKRLHAQGISYVEIGRRLGVSDTAVACACDRGLRERQRAAARKNLESLRHPCFGGCGVLVWEGFGKRSGYCIACYAEKFWRRIQHGTENEYKHGCRCPECTGAASSAKRRRRERSRVPCSHGCGAMVDSINRRWPDKPPECRDCSHARIIAEQKTAAKARAAA